jgi:hypothetical protein
MKKITFMTLAFFCLVLAALPGMAPRATEEKVAENTYVKVPSTIITENENETIQGNEVGIIRGLGPS